ncbi:cathepsin L-like [Babylonia areolata]|uniref:cathepsin L-like n=1 Tax=Babylonia areolata TaxID=304850 RepID=UPI003FD2BE46
MRFVVCVVGVVFLGVAWATKLKAFPEGKREGINLFIAWKREHGKVYRTAEEEQHRLSTFLANLKHINFLNTDHRGEVEFGVNQFTDMTSAEFRHTVLMTSRPAPLHPPDRYMKVDMPADPLPESFDWTQRSPPVVTPVKDQGSTGTCWAFSTIGNVEGQWSLQNQPLTNLSVEQVTDCDGTQDQKQLRADCGVFGGWPYLAYQYIQKAGGLETWEDYSYCSGLGGEKGTCFPCMAPGFNKTLCGPPVPYCLKNESCAAKLDPSKFVPGLKIADWKAISENETEMAAALMATGPLSIALDATMLQFYRRGVFAPFVGCSKTALNHAVLLVGWGVEKGLLESKPYWKVKNSWGHKWGQQGYFLIKRGSGECGLNTQVTTALLHKA